MNHNATNGRRERFWVWLIWLIVIASALSVGPSPEPGMNGLLLGVAVESEKEKGALFPWQRMWRVKKWA